MKRKASIFVAGIATFAAAFAYDMPRDKPIRSIDAARFSKADFHVHSAEGDDPNLRNETLDKIVSRAIEKKIDIIALVDYTGRRGTDKIRDTDGKIIGPQYSVRNLDNHAVIVNNGKQDLTIIPGAEYHNSDSGHLVVFGSNQPLTINPDAPYNLQDMIAYHKKRADIIIAPHPFVTISGGMGKEKLEQAVQQGIDATEFNAQATCFIPFVLNASKANERAASFAQDHKLPRVAVSDCHRADDVGRSFVLIPKPDYTDGNKFIESVRAGIHELRDPAIYRQRSHEAYEPWLNFTKWAVLGGHSGKLAIVTLAGTLAGGICAYIRKRK